MVTRREFKILLAECRIRNESFVAEARGGRRGRRDDAARGSPGRCGQRVAGTRSLLPDPAI
jgi:hypothetical protein